MAVWKVRLKDVPEGLALPNGGEVCVSTHAFSLTGRVIDGLYEPFTILPSTAMQGPECRIWRLPPASRWDLVVDETGSFFSGPKADGRLLVLVVPSFVSLPASTAHAAAMLGAAAQLLPQVLGRAVGIWGVRGGSPDGGSSWLTCLLGALRGALGLLPAPNGAVAPVRVWIEERSEIMAGDRLRGLELALTESYFRADGLNVPAPSLEIRVVEKRRHPWVAWADVVAWCWKEADDRLGPAVRHGLLPEHDDPRRMLLAEVLEGGGRFSPAAFDGIARLPMDDDLGGQLRLGVMRRAENLGYRRQALDHLVDHASSGRLDPVLLEQQLGLLPPASGGAESPPVALSRYIGELARANRSGEVPDVTGPRMAAAMYAEEFPVLSCQVALRVAVSLVNGLDFDGADEVLRPWADDHPANLDLRGRAWSGLGQVAASRDDRAMAEACFTAAMTCFARLSDETLRVRNQAQTGAYIAQLAVEDLDRSEAEVARAMVEAFGAPLVEDPGQAMGRKDRLGEWQALAFARWAANRSDPRRNDRLMTLWEEGRVHGHYGHPWPLVHLYLGLAVWDLADPEEVVRVWRASRDHALGFGPALAWIGVAIDVARVVKVGGQAQVEVPIDRVLAKLPRARTRWEQAKVAMAGGAEALGVVQRVLPFTFR
jgi:hypothetical protein